MPDTVNITVNASPVTVAITETAAPVAVAVTEAAAPVAVAVTEAAAPVAVAVTPVPASPVTVEFSEATPGPPGPGVTVQILTLAAYLALSPAQQMDGTWYVIPK